MSVWFEPDPFVAPLTVPKRECCSLAHHLPLEIMEKIIQLTPASEHQNLSRVCKGWHNVIREPIMKREVIVNSEKFEAAWQKDFKRIFTVNLLSRPESAAKAYGHIFALWVTRFVGQHTRTLVLTNELVNKAHLLWPSLTMLLEKRCPRLRKIIFQSGQLRLEVLEKMPVSVKLVQLDDCRVLKRHFEEGFNECLVEARNHPTVNLDFGVVRPQEVERYLRDLNCAF